MNKWGRGLEKLTEIQLERKSRVGARHYAAEINSISVNLSRNRIIPIPCRERFEKNYIDVGKTDLIEYRRHVQNRLGESTIGIDKWISCISISRNAEELLSNLDYWTISTYVAGCKNRFIDGDTGKP